MDGDTLRVELEQVSPQDSSTSFSAEIPPDPCSVGFISKNTLIVSTEHETPTHQLNYEEMGKLWFNSESAAGLYIDGVVKLEVVDTLHIKREETGDKEGVKHCIKNEELDNFRVKRQKSDSFDVILDDKTTLELIHSERGLYSENDEPGNLIKNEDVSPFCVKHEAVAAASDFKLEDDSCDVVVDEVATLELIYKERGMEEEVTLPVEIKPEVTSSADVKLEDDSCDVMVDEKATLELIYKERGMEQDVTSSFDMEPNATAVKQEGVEAGLGQDETAEVEPGVAATAGGHEWRCAFPGCSTCCTTHQHLKEHVDTSHEAFTSGGYLPSAECKHQMHESYGCKDCGNGHLSSGGLITHKRIHRETEFKCQECGEIFTSEWAFFDHTRIHSKQKYKCQYCGALFAELSAIWDHMPVHNKQKYKCPYCEELFTSQSALSGHKCILHWKCKYPTCGVRFSSVERLYQHSRVTHTNWMDTYKCNECGNACKSMHDLACHIRCKYKYEGKECEQIFTSHLALKSHIHVHRNKQNENQCKCKVCGKSFASMEAMSFHIHCKYTYEGKECEQIFNSHLALKDHICVHSKEHNLNQCKCKVCGESLPSTEALSCHIHCRCKYEGKECRQIFPSNSALFDHIRRIH